MSSVFPLDIHMHWMYAIDMMKQLAVRIVEQIHHETKIQAAHAGVTLREYVEDALKIYNLSKTINDKEDQ